MTLLVKIWGLKTPEALDAALDAGSDLVGFVFFPPLPRNVRFDAARALGARAQGRAFGWDRWSIGANDGALDLIC